MELTVDDVRSIVEGMFRRCQVARDIGGLAEIDRVNANISAPTGWTYDYQTYFWIPPHVDLDALCAGKSN